jgi:hypothetical protein
MAGAAVSTLRAHASVISAVRSGSSSREKSKDRQRASVEDALS